MTMFLLCVFAFLDGFSWFSAPGDLKLGSLRPNFSCTSFPDDLIGFGANDCHFPYEFIWFGAVDDYFPFEFIWFGAVDYQFPYEFMVFGAIDGHSHYDFIRLYGQGL